MNDIVIKQIDKKNLYVEAKFENRNYFCDYVADENANQVEVFQEVGAPIIKSFLLGYNCTVFSYGQTGSGKTYTMIGPTNCLLSESNNEKRGIIPRLIKGIFQELINLKKDKKLTNFNIKCSCFEIYQETIIDLLNTKQTNLNIREDTKKGIFIENLNEQIAEDDKTCLDILLYGMKNRHIAATTMNSDSSRSHMIFSLNMNLNLTNENGLVTNKSNRLFLIDLAGSERQKVSGIENKTDNRVKESSTINKSLLILGNVINAIVEGKFIPFRESKLTFFLKDSLVGNSYTTIIGNISPCIVNVQDSISTLKFIQRAKLIKNSVTINENVTGSTKALQDEIKRLKDELEQKEKDKTEKQYICESCLRNKSINNLMGAQHFIDVNNQVRNSVRKSMLLNPSQLVDIKKDYGGTCEAVIEEENEKRSCNSIESRDDYVDNDNKLSKDKIREFINKIEFLLNYEVVLKDKIQNMETITKSIGEINKMREIFSHETNDFKDKLDKKAIHLQSVMKINDNFLSNKLTHSQDDKESQHISNKDINSFLEEANKLQSSFNQNINQLKTDAEYQNLKKDYDLLKETKNTDLLLNKNNVDVLLTVFNDFIESNQNLQTYIAENIEMYIKDEIVEKMKIELDELRANQKMFDIMLDELRNENYLLNVENEKLKELQLINNIRTDIEKKYLELQEKYNNLLNDYDNVNNDLEEKTQEIEKLKKIIKDLEANLENKDIQNKQFQEEIDTLVEGNKLFQEELIKLKGEIDTLNEEKENYKNKVNSLEEINSYNESLISQYNEEFTKNDLNLKKLEEENNQLKMIIEENKKEINELNDTIRKISEEKDNLSDKIKSILNELEKKDFLNESIIKEAENQKLALDNRIKELNEENLNLKDKLIINEEGFNSERDNLSKTISLLNEDLNNKESEINNLKKDVSLLKEEMNKKESENLKLNEKIDTLEKDIEKLENLLNEAEKEKLLKDDKMQKLIEDVNNLGKKNEINENLYLSEKDNFNNKIKLLIDEIEKFKSEKEDLNKKNTSLIDEMKLKESELDSLTTKSAIMFDEGKIKDQEMEELKEKLIILENELKTKINEFEITSKELLRDNTSLNDKIKELNDKIKELNDKIKEFNDKIKELNDEISLLKRDYEEKKLEMESENENLKKELSFLIEEISTKNIEISNLKKNISLQEYENLELVKKINTLEKEIERTENLLKDSENENKLKEDRIQIISKEILDVHNKMKENENLYLSEKAEMMNKINSLLEELKVKDIEKEQFIEQWIIEKKEFEQKVNEFTDNLKLKEEELAYIKSQYQNELDCLSNKLIDIEKLKTEQESKYNNEIILLNEIIKELKEDNKESLVKLNNVQNENSELIEHIKKSDEENKKLNIDIEHLNSKIKEILEKSRLEEETLKQDFKSILLNLNEKIETLNNNLTDKDNEYQALINQNQLLNIQIKDLVLEGVTKDKNYETLKKETSEEHKILNKKINDIHATAFYNNINKEVLIKLLHQEKEGLHDIITQLKNQANIQELKYIDLNNEKDEEINSLNEKIKCLLAEIDSKQIFVNDQIEELKKEIIILHEKIKLMQKEIEDQKNEIQTLSADKETLNENHNKQVNEIREQNQEINKILKEKINNCEILIQDYDNQLEKVKKALFDKSNEYDETKIKHESLIEQYDKEKMEYESSIRDTENKMKEYISLCDQYSSNNYNLQQSMIEKEKENSELINKYKELLERTDNIDEIYEMFNNFNSLISQLINRLLNNTSSITNDDNEDNNQYKMIAEKLEELRVSFKNIKRKELNKEFENMCENTKVILNQILYSKANNDSFIKKNKSLEEENNILKFENKRLYQEKKYEENLNNIMNQLSLLPIINENLNKNLSSNKTDRLASNDIYSSDINVTNLKSKIQSLEIDNNLIRDKLLEISEKLAANQNNKGSLIEESEIYQMKEFLNLLKDERKRLENEVSNIRSDYYSNLSESSIEDKLQILLQLKEEYYKQKIELEDQRNLNELLKLKIQQLENKKDKNVHELTDKNNNHYSTIGDYSLINDNDTIRKEHDELIERILSLNVECISKAKSKFQKALDYLKAFGKILDIQKLYKNFFEGQISNLNERVNTTFNNETPEIPIEKEIINYMENDGYNIVEIKETIKFDGKNNEDKTGEIKQSKLYEKIFSEESKKGNLIKPVSERSSNTANSKNSKNLKIISKNIINK